MEHCRTDDEHCCEQDHRELDRPEKTVFIGMMPKMPQAIAPAIAVTARGSNSVTKKNATKARIIRVIVALSN